MQIGKSQGAAKAKKETRKSMAISTKPKATTTPPIQNQNENVELNKTVVVKEKTSDKKLPTVLKKKSIENSGAVVVNETAAKPKPKMISKTNSKSFVMMPNDDSVLLKGSADAKNRQELRKSKSVTELHKNVKKLAKPELQKTVSVCTVMHFKFKFWGFWN